MKNKNIAIAFVFGCVMLLLFLLLTTEKQQAVSAVVNKEIAYKTKPVVIAYVGGYRGNINTDSIDAPRLTHINYAFVDIKDNRAWLHNRTDDSNLKKLVALKARNPNLKILISIGGWTWSKHFSDAVLTDTARKKFAESAVEIVAKYKLDGVDIDWEYPGMIGDSNVYRPEDKGNYTLMFKDLRSSLDSLGKITHEKYFISLAAGASAEFLEHTEMDKVQKYADFINLMTYDFTDVLDTVAIHHTNLYASPGAPKQRSADAGILQFEAAGVPADKLVLGIAFYGHAIEMRTTDNKGLNRKAAKRVPVGGFTFINDSLVNKRGFVRYWDTAAHAPYLFNEARKIFITYDDEESVKDKCEYAMQHGLAGVMFWEYFSDKKEYLLKTIDNTFK
ncbi:MAG TPA: glycoside hydrolase family 18 protein [Chitinophagaceae bacterium]|nr:glycoside hydrolase family 18 protein [Chitinophagaceae bacterium]